MLKHECFKMTINEKLVTWDSLKGPVYSVNPESLLVTQMDDFYNVYLQG